MPQYTFDGSIYEEEEVLAAAEQAGLSLEQYVKEFDLKTDNSYNAGEMKSLQRDVYQKVLSVMPGNVMPPFMQPFFGVTAAPVISGTLDIVSGVVKTAEVAVEEAMGYTKEEMIEDVTNSEEKNHRTAPRVSENAALSALASGMK